MAPVREPGNALPFDLEAAGRAQYRSLVRLASLLLEDIDRGEEVVQDAFVAVWRRRPDPRGDERMPANGGLATVGGRLKGPRSTRRTASAGRSKPVPHASSRRPTP